jgi:hypothetical protein
MKATELYGRRQQELDEIWSGLTGIVRWLADVVPTDNMQMLGGQAEMQDYIKKNIKGMMTLAGRYMDRNDQPIGNKNLQDIPLRAIYAFMRSGMRLPDDEINGVMVAASNNRKLERFKPTHILHVNDMKGDAVLQDVYPKIDANAAKEILDKLIGIASVRSMEVRQFGGVGQGNQQVARQQASQPAARQAGQQATAPGTASATEPTAAQTSQSAPVTRRVALQQALNQLLSQP